MENLKNVSNKIKKTFYNTVVQAVLISFLMVIIVAVAVGVLVWTHRMDIVNFLVDEYKSQQSKIATEIKIPIVMENEIKEEVLTNPIVEKKEAPTIVEAVKKAKPAVVSIVVSQEVPKYDITYQKENALDINGQIIPNLYIQKPIYTENGVEKKELGSGSGFLISSDGLIVTNRHVVAQKDAIFSVFLNNGKEYSAKVLARDPVLDVALLKISGSNFPYLKLADSDSLEVGETVIAIGNALGEFKNTVSAGVVSGLSRSITAGDSFGQMEYLDKVIQTDAAINRGNSGGPLLNIYGEVVGINVAMVEGSSSIGFSLPINSVKGAIDSVKKIGIISRPYVGIRYVLINPDLKVKYDLPFDYGILIQKGLTLNDPAIIPNSPAEKAGLKEGDIVIEIDGKKVDQDSNFSHFIRYKKIGDFITMKVYSNGVTRTVVVVLEQAPENL